jgi:predicted ferric reductase
VEPLATTRARFPGFCTIMTVLSLSLVATFCFSPVFNYSAQNYFTSVSPYAVANIRLSHLFVAKVYEDALVFYIVLGTIAAAALVSQASPAVKRLLHRRLRVPGDPSWPRHPFPHGVSVGELLVVAAVAGLYAYWLYYWRFKYTRIEKESKPDTHPLAQIWARVFGHFSNLSFSLLLLPAARNSMWVSVFGMPFDRAIKYHRFLGVIAYWSVTTHMLIWFGKWGVQGLLANNLTNFHNLKIMPSNYTILPDGTCWPAQPVTPHWDNFTIVMNWVAWLCLTAMYGLALFCRRRNYELFHYAHHFAWVYYMLALMHSWSLWYYASAGLMLYAIDRCIRWTRGVTASTIVSLDHHGDVAVIRIPTQVLRLQRYAGQFSFVNVPALSQLQWHPFTMSSAPSAPDLSFHIKSMGPDTWSGQLLSLAKSQVMTEVRVDGPYGKPGSYADKRVVVLVAGGIGITPMHSIFAELYARACRQAAETSASVNNSVSRNGRTGSSSSVVASPVQRVVLVWSARSTVIFSLFSSTFLAVEQHNPSKAFTVQLHISQAAAALSGDGMPGRMASAGRATSSGTVSSSEGIHGDFTEEAVAYTKSIVQVRRGCRVVRVSWRACLVASRGVALASNHHVSCWLASRCAARFCWGRCVCVCVLPHA